MDCSYPATAQKPRTMTDRLALADLTLFPATPEQTIESRKRTFVQWARGQSLEEYLHKDAIQENDEHAANGKLITWVLAPRSDPSTLDFLCSCETFRRAALVARHSPTSPALPLAASTADVQEVTAYAVASVFTPPQNRRKGYAQHMMRLLHWALAPPAALSPSTFPTAEWGPPPDARMPADARFSVLYSDVGREFYRACGTAPGARDGWVFKLKPDVLRLTESDVAALYAHDARWIRDDLARGRSSASSSGLSSCSPGASIARVGARTLCTFLPDAGVGLFVVRRTMDFTPALEPVLPTSTWGLALLPPSASTLSDVLIPAPSASPFPFVTYTLDPRALVVARLRADAETLPALLAALLVVARSERVEKVELWYMPAALRAVAEREGWRTAERGEHLSALKWYDSDGGHGTPGGRGEEREMEEEVEWVYNEKCVSDSSCATGLLGSGTHACVVWLWLTGVFTCRFCWC
ncbi:hypothetical protein C8Q80DRAFT_1321816 [Daedaleopsis nitida]|nr:hypothetical protein C8Q80DRAFT_1321816 [Daedaleopsis nitida]